LQLSQASTAVEVLGALAKSGRGGFTNFQKVANDLLAAHPGLASLDLEPGGVVSDIVPRARYERAIGFNVLKDVGQRAAANEAIARRVLTVTCPVTLYHGEPGIVARIPVFQRTLDGRESLWGFVAVSMRLQEALAQAQLDELPRQGYTFALFTPTSTPHKNVVIASHGLSSLQDTVQQPVRVQNLELRLALKPQGGWIDKTKVVLESLVVILISALVSLLVNLMESRRALEAGLTEATQRLTRKDADRTRAQLDGSGINERMTAIQAELKQTQLALEQAESKIAKIQGLLDASTRERDEAVQINQVEQKKAHAALAKAHETIAQLQVRLDAATQAENKTTSAAEKRLQQNQTAMAEMRVRLEAAARSARDMAEASAATLAQLEQSNRESKERLLAVERAEARITELNGLLQKAQEELRHRQDVSSKGADAPPLESGHKASRPGAEASPRVRLSIDSSTDFSSASALSSVAEAPAKPVTEKLTSVSNPKGRLNSTEPIMLVAAQGAVETTLEVASPAEPSVSRRSASKPPKRSKVRRDDQMDLFKSEDAMVQATNQSVAKVVDPVIGAKKPKIAEIETVVASELLVGPNTVAQAQEDKPAPARRLPAAPPVDLPQLRKAVNQIVPLLADQDPGAKDCLKDNRSTFRSVFTPEGYVEFEQLVKSSRFDNALEQLKKAARKHGIAL
jgi:sensor domain CHASE-containing protein